MTAVVAPTTRKPVVLLVDDDRDVSVVVREMLRLTKPGVDYAAVGSIEEGLKATEWMHPEIVVLDHHFAGDARSGTEMIPEFRQAGAGLVVVFTASVDLTETEIAGADAVLDKLSLPILPETIALLLAEPELELGVVDLRDEQPALKQVATD